MKRKYIAYALLPAMALALVGAGTASAHGLFGGFGMGGANATPAQLAEAHSKMFQIQSQMLGINIDEVKQAWSEGKTFAELAQEKGISEETIKAKAKELRKTQLQEHLKSLVEQGVITQAQADSRLKFMEEKMNNLESGKIGGKGMRGGHGMMLGPGW